MRTRCPNSTVVLAAAALGLACKSETPTPPSTGEGASAASQPATAAASEGGGMMGPLTEAEFAALHELKEGESPELYGKTIDLDGTRAYLSMPEGATAPVPGIVVVHEWWGLNDHIRHYADRLASQGYAALAVDLYGGATATDPDTAMKLMKAVEDEPAKKIIRSGLAFLRTDAAVKAPKVASIGWCFGGKWSLQTAIMDAELDAAVVYYGFPTTDVEVLKQIGADMLLFYGEQDEFIPMENVKKFRAAMKEAGVEHTLHTYPAHHAFANPSNAHYQAEFAEDAWKKTTAFLAEHLRD